MLHNKFFNIKFRALSPFIKCYYCLWSKGKIPIRDWIFLNTLHLQVICLVQTRPKAWVCIEPPRCTGSWQFLCCCRTTCLCLRDSTLVLRGLTPPPSPPLRSSWVRSGSGYWQSGSPGRGRSVHSLTPQTGTPEEREARWNMVLAAISSTFTPQEEISFI